MARLATVPIVLAVAAIAALGPAGSAAPAGSPARIVVGYTATGISAANALERRLQLARVAEIPQLRVHVLQVAPARAGEALAALRDDPLVRYAERDRLVRALRVPDDAFWSTQWSPVKTRAVQAWDRTTGSEAVVIAVVDTGIDSTHPDLRGQLVPGFDEVNNDADPQDDNGHGTSAAGIAAARSDNGIGVAGYCWRCRLMPVKVLDSEGTGFSSTAALGIVWATDHGARVINASLGGPEEDSTLAAAAQYARTHGVLLVAAAGNDSSSLLGYPAALPGVVSVSASNERDELYAFSNTGAGLAAPGDNSTTALSGGYESFLGTSSAAPVVSGIAGLLFSALPTATPEQVASALYAGAVPLPGVVYGRVDASRALAALVPPPPVQPESPSPGSSSGPRATGVKVVSGRLGRRGRSVWVTTGPGVLRATVVVRRPARRAVRLRLSRGRLVVASRSGRRRVRIVARVRAGRYRLTVAGPAGLSFRLTLDYPRPA